MKNGDIVSAEREAYSESATFTVRLFVGHSRSFASRFGFPQSIGFSDRAHVGLRLVVWWQPSIALHSSGSGVISRQRYDQVALIKRQKIAQ